MSEVDVLVVGHLLLVRVGLVGFVDLQDAVRQLRGHPLALPSAKLEATLLLLEHDHPHHLRRRLVERLLLRRYVESHEVGILKEQPDTHASWRRSYLVLAGDSTIAVTAGRPHSKTMAGSNGM